MIIKTLKFMALLVAITSLSACASDSAPKANGDITSQATQPPSDVLDIEFVIEDIDDIDDTEDIEDTDDIDDIDAIDAADDNSNFSEIPRSSDEPMLFDDNEDIDPALDNPRIGRATDKPLQIEDIDDSDPSLENPSIARATDKPLQLEDDDDSGDSDGDFDIPEIPRSDPQTPYWSELDFDKNIEYAEAIETFGDLGAAKGAISAFNKMRDERLIPDYNATASYWMTFTGIKDIKGEDCYVYRFEEIDVCMS
ncbi:MAG: hypothetical protein LBT59_28295, partial [Clostridiales bacterium]|nr:hypothetical protein [Clostridiales bacterium]